jgi:hypothetical protein
LPEAGVGHDGHVAATIEATQPAARDQSGGFLEQCGLWSDPRDPESQAFI